jgi:hypothetical protein
MALVDLAGGLYLPAIPMLQPGQGTYLGAPFAVGEVIQVIFQVPRSGAVAKYGWLQGSNGTSPAFNVRMGLSPVQSNGQAASANYYCDVGVPSENNWVWSPTISDNGLPSGARLTVTRGQLLAAYWYLTAFTAGGPNVLAWQAPAGGVWTAVPYMLKVVGATLSFYTDRYPIGALQYEDGTIVPIQPPGALLPWWYSAPQTLTVSSAPDEAGLLFLVPAPMRLSGVWMSANLGPPTSDPTNLTLYEGTTVRLQETMPAGPRIGGSYLYALHLFATPWDLTPNVAYRATLAPTGTATANLFAYILADGASRAGIDNGLNMALTTRTDGGAFTDSANLLPLMGLYISAVDSGADVGTGSRLNRGLN